MYDGLHATIDNENGDIPYVQAEIQSIFIEDVKVPIGGGFVSAEGVCDGLEAECEQYGVK